MADSALSSIASLDGPSLDEVDLLALKGTATIAVCLPARDEETTVGEIVATIRNELVGRHGSVPGLVDELVVIDDHSTDRTAAAAAAAGALVLPVGDVLPAAGSGTGKGNALWKSVAATSSELIVWCDADLRRFNPRFITRLIAPLLTRPELGFVKGFYDRPRGNDPAGGGRTTALMARPLLSLLYPHLAEIHQPLGGEYAARRTILEQVPFVEGYGVEIALLIDIAERFGIDIIGEIHLGTRLHRHRPLHELSAQAMEVLQVVLHRAGVVTDADWSHVLVFPGHEPVEVEHRERPPLITVPDYRANHPAAVARHA